jgi:hypothetical protein
MLAREGGSSHRRLDMRGPRRPKAAAVFEARRRSIAIGVIHADRLMN